MIKVKDGFEPSLQNLQFYTLPLCYLTTLNLKRLILRRKRWDLNPRYLLDTLAFKTNALNHSTTYPFYTSISTVVE